MVTYHEPGPKPEQIQWAVSKVFNIDNGNGTTADDVFSFPGPIQVVHVRIVYTEASDSSMVPGTFKVGTAVGGAQIVAATSQEESKSVGTYTEGTIVAGAGYIPANGILAIRHTGVATTQLGEYKVLIGYI